MQSAPVPWELTRVDLEARKINLPVIVLGTAAHQLLSVVFRQTATEGAQGIDLTRPGEASFTYLPMQLGDIRGYSSHLHLYGFEIDPRLAPMVGEYSRAAAGVVLAFQEAPNEEGAAFIAILARSIPAKLPVATLGPAEVAKSWQALHDTPPVHAGAADDASIFPALKAVAREMLSALRSG